MIDLSQARVPGLARRLATMVYDLLLLFGVLVVAAAAFFAPFQVLTGRITIDGPARTLLQVWLFVVILAYYLYFWTAGRQTLGMRAWRTGLLRADGGALRVVDALRRFAWAALTLAPAGLGLWLALFDRDRLTWYDRLSATRPVLLARPARPAKGVRR